MKSNDNITNLAKSFRIPIIVLAGIIVFLILNLAGEKTIANILIIFIIFLGSYRLFQETAISLLKKHFALDYIAILAIAISIITNEYFVASILALMIASGRTLEEYGVTQAKKSLTKLVDRIPNDVVLWEGGIANKKEQIGNIKIGQEIFVRKGEVIGLDGILISKTALTDESSLTGEPYLMEKIKGDQIRSGTINIGNPIAIKVIKTQQNSTYNKIIDLVKSAQKEKAPLVRLADKYSTIFTLITAVIAGFAYFNSHSMQYVLAVLVIATPCPLILATPIALLGGVSAAAKRRIIVKKLASIEILSRANTFIFDKTGTITLGKPRLTKYISYSSAYSQKEILGIAEAIERNSLHPLAKAIVIFAKEKQGDVLMASNIKEVVGSGISGKIKGRTYTLAKENVDGGMSIALSEGKNKLAVFKFEDEIKQESKTIIDSLKKLGISIYIFTGDKKAAAQKVANILGGGVTVQAECTPKDKQEGIKALKKHGKITAMVGDGINDAPALALSDVGIVFSNEEQTAASEASDIVFLGNDFSLILDSINISKRTIHIALQSIGWGIGLSVGGMIFASIGMIPPIFGAFFQEAIDVAVIINALRASRY